jgi:hypothetical protein
MSEERFLDVLDQIEGLGFRMELVFIGGEPTLHSQCVKFMQLSHERDFRQTLWSNAYSKRAKDTIVKVRELDLGRVAEGTHKFNGAVAGFHNPYIFCSPADMGVTRSPCKWGYDSGSWGYSVDEQGFSPCPIGTMIAHYSAPATYANELKDLVDPLYMDIVYQELCKHCGSFLPLDVCFGKVDRSKIKDVNGTKMTETWQVIFS